MGRPRVNHPRRAIDHPAPTPQDTPCRLWQGSTAGQGYGTMHRNGDKVYLHRWVYEKALGQPIPTGLHVMHLCDQPLCFRFEHLRLGTHSDNMMDMVRKGRGRGLIQRTECAKGHQLERLGPCVTCRREYQKLYARRRRASERIAKLVMLALLVGSLVLIPSRSRADETVRRGDTGPLVTEVQTILASFEYTVVTDGRFGPQTERAVRAWQRSNGLRVDGIVGARTVESLRTAARRHNAQQVTPTVPAPSRSVEQIIRDVWPDDLEERALTIAYRESRLDPAARNYCCHGLFQIYWSIHRGWMRLDSVDQLYDAETNARMALALYQRAGGWGPWSQTNY